MVNFVSYFSSFCVAHCIYTCSFFFKGLPFPAEVIGAIISVLLIWVLTGVLVYEAILRVINRDYIINADVMLIISCAGVFLNVL